MVASSFDMPVLVFQHEHHYLYFLSDGNEVAFSGQLQPSSLIVAGIGF